MPLKPTKSPPRRKARTQASARGATFEALRQVALALPGVEDGTSYGTPALKVRGKLFVRLREDCESVVLPTDYDEREILLEAAPDVFFLTDHYRNYPWILLRLAAVALADLPEILENAWRRVAPKRLVAERERDRAR
jgi:hypothetical protein